MGLDDCVKRTPEDRAAAGLPSALNFPPSQPSDAVTDPLPRHRVEVQTDNPDEKVPEKQLTHSNHLTERKHHYSPPTYASPDCNNASRTRPRFSNLSYTTAPTYYENRDPQRIRRRHRSIAPQHRDYQYCPNHPPSYAVAAIGQASLVLHRRKHHDQTDKLPHPDSPDDSTIDSSLGESNQQHKPSPNFYPPAPDDPTR